MNSGARANMPHLLSTAAPPLSGQSAEPAASERYLGLFALTAVVMLIGQALQISDGFLNDTALLLLTLALAAATCAFVAPRIGWVERQGPRLLPAVAGFALIFELWSLLQKAPAAYLEVKDLRWAWLFVGGILLAALIGGFGPSRIAPRHWLSAMVVIHFILGVWIVRMTPAPYIDMFCLHRESCNAFLHGHNPYTVTWPDIYGNRVGNIPGTVVNGRVVGGFPYPPISLLCALPGYLAGDFRYSQLAAMSIAALLLAFARGTRLSAVVAALVLFTPRTFYMIEEGWTEPFIIVFLAATLYCAARGHTRLVPVFLGLFLASKQHMVLAIPAAALLVGTPFHWRRYARMLGIALATAACVTLPFFLWNPPAFFQAVVIRHLHKDFRLDCLSWSAWMVAHGGAVVTNAVALPASLLVMALALWKLPCTSAAFAAALGVQFLVFFLFNNSACNYYYMVLAMFGAAVAFATPASLRPAPPWRRSTASIPATTAASPPAGQF